MELNEIKLSQSIAAAQRASKYSDRDVYVNCLGDLEIRNAKGTLTEDDISSDLCLNLFALIITNAKCPLKANRLAEELWPEDVIDNPYRTVSNIAYRLRRILSIIGLEDLIVGRHARPFSKRLYCGRCGSLCRSKKTNDVWYWVCRRHEEENAQCDIPPVPEDAITAAFLAMYETIDPREYESYRMRRVFQKEEPRSELDARLIAMNVSAVLVDSNGKVKIRLKNDQIIERGE